MQCVENLKNYILLPQNTHIKNRPCAKEFRVLVVLEGVRGGLDLGNSFEVSFTRLAEFYRASATMRGPH